ncbi:unnamed protein product, partial [marine sediment metagenome]
LAETKRYKVYTATGIPTKAELTKRAYKLAEEMDVHEEFIDFIPIRYTLQYHFWGRDLEFGKVAEYKAKCRAANWNIRRLEKGLANVPAHKGHFDLRVQKFTAPSWFGQTLYREPWTGRAEPGKRVEGGAKGYMQLTRLGKKLRKMIEGMRTGAGQTVGLGKWMKFDGELRGAKRGAGETELPEYMLIVERGIGVMHRRELDFIDVTYCGFEGEDWKKAKMVGRYFNRLVRRKVAEEERPKTFKRAYVTKWYFWLAKTQFDMNVMRACAERKVR